MNRLKYLGCIAAATGMMGCSNLPMTLTSDDKNHSEVIAVLTDYELDDGFITIQAVGYGCTFINSFKLAVADVSDNSLEVIRTRPDKCRMKPRNVSLQYSYKHLGLDLNRQISVRNPVTVALANYTASN